MTEINKPANVEMQGRPAILAVGDQAFAERHHRSTAGWYAGCTLPCFNQRAGFFLSGRENTSRPVIFETAPHDTDAICEQGGCQCIALIAGVRFSVKGKADGPGPVDQGPAGPAMIDRDAAKAFRCWPRTVERLRRCFVEQGLEACLRHGNIGAPRKKTFDGEAEAHLIALGCSQPPDGRVRWTLQLLADRVVELGIVESCSIATVHQTLKKTNSSLT